MDRDLSLLEKKGIASFLSARGDRDLFTTVAFSNLGGKKKKTEFFVTVGKYRLYMFNPKALQKGQAIHMLDIVEIASSSPTEFCFKLRGSGKSVEGECSRSDELFKVIISTFWNTFPGFSPFQHLRLLLLPKERIEALQKTVNVPDPGPCGGFTKSYKSVCAYMGLPWRVDVSWDVAHQYEQNSIDELNLRDFTFDAPMDFKAFITTLKFNRYFKGIVYDPPNPHNSRGLPKEALQGLAEVLRSNDFLEKLVLKGCNGGGNGEKGIKEAITACCSALAGNSLSAVRILDLTCTTLEDKAASSLSQWLRLNCGNGGGTQGIRIRVGGLNSGLSSNGLKSITESFSSGNIQARLVEFGAGHVKVDSASSYALGQALRDLKALTSIQLEAMGPNVKLEPITGGFRKINSLVKLDLSGNKFNFGVNSSQYFDLSGYLKHAVTLRELNFARCGMVHATLIEFLKLIPSVVKLDASDNDFGDKGLSELFEFLASTAIKSNYKHIILDRNFTAGKSKYREAAVNSLVKFLNSASVNSLSLAGGGKLGIKEDILPLFQALFENKTLQELDVSGHGFGDPGAVTIARTIQLNSCLKVIRLDENNITITGLKALVNGLERNKSVTNMSLPIVDILALGKEKTMALQILTQKMMESLTRNASLSSPTGLTLQDLSIENREEIAKAIRKIDSVTGSPKKITNSVDDLDTRIRELLGDTFLAGAVSEISTNSQQTLLQKITWQLSEIVSVTPQGEGPKSSRPALKTSQSQFISSDDLTSHQKEKNRTQTLVKEQARWQSVSSVPNSPVLGTAQKKLERHQTEAKLAELFQLDAEDDVPMRPPQRVMSEEAKKRLSYKPPPTHATYSPPIVSNIPQSPTSSIEDEPDLFIRTVTGDTEDDDDDEVPPPPEETPPATLRGTY
eukprot:TRINITY_DN12650_c0_g1_i1.p1 TRINITY_DN12650_c0_g1~~TRINITY_DN12650_c0_g1_i1.p1  ORF type:complete len:907 (+),score=230.04 TRINITY_DN12650_c0_g1_i1:50-2770(+)